MMTCITRDGSGNALKHHVWGTRYIDELVRVSNVEENGEAFEYTDCWACQDSNYNVLGVVDASAVLAERYEYTPYGQRTAFFSPGSNDVGCYAPTQTSRRATQGGTDLPFALCEVGHQGLVHDEEVGLVYNRARQLHPGMGRFVQRDPLGYVDGSSLYGAYTGTPISKVDPSGNGAWCTCTGGPPVGGVPPAAGLCNAGTLGNTVAGPVGPAGGICPAPPPLPLWPPPTQHQIAYWCIHRGLCRNQACNWKLDFVCSVDNFGVFFWKNVVSDTCP